MNEKKLVEPLLDRLLGEDIEVELTVGDSQFESEQLFDALEARKIGNVIAWRRLRGRENPPYVLTVKDRIDVEGPEHLRVSARAFILRTLIYRSAHTHSLGTNLRTISVSLQY